MIIYPAMDLMDGNVVRLKQGDFKEKVIYEKDPVKQAKVFQASGATHLHIIDLDGAKLGSPKNLKVILNIKKETGLFIQVGGGLRDEKKIISLLEAGIDRVILGSFALMFPKETKRLNDTYPNRILIAVDTKDGVVTYNGWQQKSLYTLASYLEDLQKDGFKDVMVTDISKDGMLQGIDITLYDTLSITYPKLNIIASGGVTSLDEIKAFKNTPVSGVIIGVALYQDIFTLEEALSC
jgi:phosphoribosylformimino-5-aminoimidazole carboxamide ribotide isomerase